MIKKALLDDAIPLGIMIYVCGHSIYVATDATDANVEQGTTNLAFTVYKLCHTGHLTILYTAVYRAQDSCYEAYTTNAQSPIVHGAAPGRTVALQSLALSDPQPWRAKRAVPEL